MSGIKRKHFLFILFFVISVCVFFFCLLIPLAAGGDERDKKGGIHDGKIQSEHLHLQPVDWDVYVGVVVVTVMFGHILKSHLELTGSSG